jgi:hypothetical protein
MLVSYEMGRAGVKAVSIGRSISHVPLSCIWARDLSFGSAA